MLRVPWPVWEGFGHSCSGLSCAVAVWGELRARGRASLASSYTKKRSFAQRKAVKLGKGLERQSNEELLGVGVLSPGREGLGELLPLATITWKEVAARWRSVFSLRRPEKKTKNKWHQAVLGGFKLAIRKNSWQKGWLNIKTGCSLSLEMLKERPSVALSTVVWLAGWCLGWTRLLLSSFPASLAAILSFPAELFSEELLAHLCDGSAEHSAGALINSALKHEGLWLN